MTNTNEAVLVVIDAAPAGGIANSAAELIGAAAGIGAPVALATSAMGSDEELASALGGLGAARVLIADIDDAALTVPLADAVVAAISATQPAAIIFSNSIAGRDVAARVAVRQRRALLADVTGVRRDEEGVITDHSVFGGNYLTVGAATHSAPVITVRQGAVDARAEGVQASVEKLEVARSGKRAATVTGTSIAEQTSSRPNLRTADKVVAGGRALGSPEKFEELVGGLADALGAAVGASRVAVDTGYIPADHQVGQTGVVVSPQLYIALGISGAIQHLAGMQTADTIVAINNDAESPIFEIADFGVVGDIFEVVPQLIDAVNERK
ncbi:electron transfer flavoprotein subunit alpha/FixB family protein [Corynebacterium sp. TA-R-1]|uniref:Electron transfer flavoprotein subunit alpha/FixB family protein n=1 Tax=Corynebacterium stercoris TaxID=2943490 RepID=A0ABT1G5P9_9CORY|nr:electron transfer flavoprotein subunit alpha/FixB family protein [Corynebacterium stercoris]MCP1388338.1 electron transfer flavoprotein subunit alpha/FixB family protein [Corynebacterium stercoris]